MLTIDIEMPIYCYDCPCHNRENERCNITGDSTFDKRPFDCPLKEVKHGHWNKTCVPDIYQCDVCKKPVKMDEFCDNEVLREFCPKCGADMRGEKPDE